MRKTMLMLAVFGLAGSLWAADPIIGTWKLNFAKSKIPSTEKAPKEQIEIYRELNGKQIELTFSGTEADGSPISGKWMFPLEGGIATSQPPRPKDMLYVEGMIEPGNWCVIVMQGGKQIGRIHKIVAKDGKTMGQTFKGKDDKGRPFERLWFYDRQ